MASGMRLRQRPVRRQGLRDAVRLHYSNAYSFQRQSKWKLAQDEYREVVQLIPDLTHPINKNVREQLNRVNSELLRLNSRSGPSRW